MNAPFIKYMVYDTFQTQRNNFIYPNKKPMSCWTLNCTRYSQVRGVEKSKRLSFYKTPLFALIKTILATTCFSIVILSLVRIPRKVIEKMNMQKREIRVYKFLNQRTLIPGVPIKHSLKKASLYVEVAKSKTYVVTWYLCLKNIKLNALLVHRKQFVFVWSCGSILVGQFKSNFRSWVECGKWDIMVRHWLWFYVKVNCF